MHHSSRNTFGKAFTLGVGAGILIHTFFKKIPASAKSTHWLKEPIKQRFYYLKDFSAGLIANPIPDLYKATDSLTLSEDDLIHASE